MWMKQSCLILLNRLNFITMYQMSLNYSKYRSNNHLYLYQFIINNEDKHCDEHVLVNIILSLHRSYPIYYHVLDAVINCRWLYLCKNLKTSNSSVSNPKNDVAIASSVFYHLWLHMLTPLKHLKSKPTQEWMRGFKFANTWLFRFQNISFQLYLQTT